MENLKNISWMLNEKKAFDGSKRNPSLRCPPKYVTTQKYLRNIYEAMINGVKFHLI